MKCFKCIANDYGNCKAGIRPYHLVDGNLGCTCNTAQVRKYKGEYQTPKSSVTTEQNDTVKAANQFLNINDALEKISEAISTGNFNQLDITFIFRQQKENEWIGRVTIDNKTPEIIAEDQNQMEE